MSRPSGAVRRDAPVWFVRAAESDRAALLQLPAARHWIALADGEVGCWDRGFAWLPIDDRVIAVPLSSPPRVLGTGELTSDDVLVRVGDRRVEVVEGRLVHDRPTDPLPDTAARARVFATFSGGGALWADHGWLYRRRPGEAARAVGPFADGDRLHAGPDGALLVGDARHWHAVAGPRSAMRPLPVPLRADGPVRFSRTGRRVAGTSEHDGIVVDTVTGELCARRPGALPLTDRAMITPGDPDVAGEALLSSPVVVQGGLLGGPGGRLWDLDTARPVEHAMLGPGPHAACGRRWATWDGDGVLRWLHARTGEDEAEIEVGLAPGEDVVTAWSIGDVAVLATTTGRRVGVRHDGVVAVPAGEPPALPGRPASDAWARLGFERLLEHGGRTWAWSSAGLLAVAPCCS